MVVMISESTVNEYKKKLTKDREHYINDNVKLVHYLIRRYFFHYVNTPEYDDLFQEGCYALTLSAINYDPELGNKFSTYCVPTILGYMRRYIREKTNTIKLPRDLLDKKVQLNKIINDDPDRSVSDICQELGIDNNDYLMITGSLISSLDMEISKEDSDNSSAFHELIQDPLAEYEDYLVTKDQVLNSIFSITKNLPKLSRYLYEDYIFSKIYDEAMTQKELAGKYGISQSYVSRIVSKINNKVKEYIKKNGGLV